MRIKKRLASLPVRNEVDVKNWHLCNNAFCAFICRSGLLVTKKDTVFKVDP